MQKAQALEVNSPGSGSSLLCALVGGVTGGRVPCVGVIVPPCPGLCEDLAGGLPGLPGQGSEALSDEDEDETSLQLLSADRACAACRDSPGLQRGMLERGLRMSPGLCVKPLMDRHIALPLSNTRRWLLSSCCAPKPASWYE